MKQIPVKYRFIVGACLLFMLGTAAADMYVYELPNGTRIITEHALNNRHYRLVHTIPGHSGLDLLSVSKDPQFFRPDPANYDGLIQKAASQHALEPALVKAVMRAESAFNPFATSHKGASGLMQLMPATAARFGVTDIYDPEQNVHAGARYLKFLLRKFDNQYHLAIAAYNAGEGTVMRYKGIPPYAETKKYVRKVLRFKRHYAPLFSSDA